MWVSANQPICCQTFSTLDIDTWVLGHHSSKSAQSCLAVRSSFCYKASSIVSIISWVNFFFLVCFGKSPRHDFVQNLCNSLYNDCRVMTIPLTINNLRHRIAVLLQCHYSPSCFDTYSGHSAQFSHIKWQRADLTTPWNSKIVAYIVLLLEVRTFTYVKIIWKVLVGESTW